ncbi:2-oxo acid dehydrogenase subunit E2 [Streptomyces harbinensis]|uniref:dihydrolipoamide acetyltransferase family protein n=1 Tax=Streptomyces harbinensis TaxID=1176198 RepID=UPI00159159C7|nr:dihydrolipoamide acetyltransferase family protein [Streptomyces harbinensis]QKV69849.1 2-oxo acid dehydrogenase subunit E2 [Streptomyces harbinensis]
MAQTFLLPDLGEGLTGAEIVRWLVEVGDAVTVDQPVVEVETAKAMVEVPCPYAGVVTERFGAVGEEVPVGSPLVRVGAPGAGSGAAPDGAGPDAHLPDDGPPDGGSGQVLVGYGTGTTTSPGAPPPAPAAPAPRPAVAVISPLVRKLARDHGIDLRTVRGSGPDGLILRADIEARTAPPAPPAPAPASALGRETAGEATRTPLRGIAATAAARLGRSRTEIPDATCWVDADATELLAARRATELPLLALLARICVAALARYPQLNATFDPADNAIVTFPAVHLGFAAQTDRGLLVPVLRDAHRRTTRELGAGLTRLTESARAGTLAPADLTGSTFTLNNYGVFGVDGSTPILNHPEAAMLGIGRIVPRPWAHQGELALRQVVQLSLTFDHRVCDGAVAGGFLRQVADRVESPLSLLADL